MTFEGMWNELLPVGRSSRSGGYFRQPFSSAEREAAAWFKDQVGSRGLTLEEDPFGNLVAWWDPVDPTDSKPRADAVLTGSHLDSVLDGGAFDGPLGVVSALAAVDRMRADGIEPRRPLGIAVFLEEEGSSFSQACLGSRLAVGELGWDRARELRDRDGRALADLIEGGAPATWLDAVACYVELHIEQGRDLVHRDLPVAVGSEIWPHGRYRFDFGGEANHAGATRMEDRHDPMLTYAAVALSANRIARESSQRATFGRLSTEPNATNAVPSHVTAWLDARASSETQLTELVAQLTAEAERQAADDGTRVEVCVESVSPAVSFDPDLSAAINRGGTGAGSGWPVIPTCAGHDAGVLSEAGIPSAMLFVRNPTGVSHSPAETAPLDDCLAGVEALADALSALVS